MDEQDVWSPDGPMSQAFNLDENESEKIASKKKDEQVEEFASDEGRYPCETKKEAKRSLLRAAENEPTEEFKKIAQRITDAYPEFIKEPEDHMDKAASIGRELGENIAEGFINSIKGQAT